MTDPNPVPSTGAPSAPTSAPVAEREPASQADPLARLYHMSTTAGVGSQDYVAINPTSVASLLLGFAGVLVILSDLLLVIPLAGAICGIVAIVQIRRSSGTQTGLAIASLGLLISLLLGGGRLGQLLLGEFRQSADENQVAAVMKQLGADLGAGHYEQAYALCTDRFRDRVSFSEFETLFRAWQRNGIGTVRSVEWNREHMQIDPKPDTNLKIAEAMALFRFANADQPSRIVLVFTGGDGKWQIDDMPTLFKPKKPAGARE